jgi:hypothetical protein
MLKGSCHCGAVVFEIPRPPETLTDCNCSICRRLASLWAYFKEEDVRFTAGAEATDTYVTGDRVLAFHRCKSCGCTTHWAHLEPKRENRMGVNCRMLDPKDIADIRVRRLDGADTWKYLD